MNLINFFQIHNKLKVIDGGQGSGNFGHAGRPGQVGGSGGGAQATDDYIRGFSVKVVDEVNMYENGNSIVIEDFIKFLRDWLINHIMVDDKKFVEELKIKLSNMSENDMQ